MFTFLSLSLNLTLPTCPLGRPVLLCFLETSALAQNIAGKCKELSKLRRKAQGRNSRPVLTANLERRQKMRRRVGHNLVQLQELQVGRDKALSTQDGGAVRNFLRELSLVIRHDKTRLLGGLDRRSGVSRNLGGGPWSEVANGFLWGSGRWRG
ncbi:hypothetical protein J010_03027 [Cryptococcus neoformans]|nr:hypothetical protein J010_03027 [Cryptococcus neoformans var. grubii]